MDNDFNSWIDNLPTEIEGERAAPQGQRFTCYECAGTGYYRGVRVHQEKSHCFACRGKGYFTTPPKQRERARQNAAAKREAEKAENRAYNERHFGGTLAALTFCADWSEFARDILMDHAQGKQLAEKRMLAAASMIAKVAAKREAKAAAANAKGGAVDLSRIEEMFAAARENGHEKPVYRAEGLKISLAPAHGRNAGALYVVLLDGDAYQGKVEGKQFKAVREASDETMPALLRIAENPLEAAVAFGRKTGKCACCGRKLENKISVEMGIGPICRERWGL